MNKNISFLLYLSLLSTTVAMDAVDSTPKTEPAQRSGCLRFVPEVVRTNFEERADRQKLQTQEQEQTRERARAQTDRHKQAPEEIEAFEKSPEYSASQTNAQKEYEKNIARAEEVKRNGYTVNERAEECLAKLRMETEQKRQLFNARGSDCYTTMTDYALALLNEEAYIRENTDYAFSRVVLRELASSHRYESSVFMSISEPNELELELRNKWKAVVPAYVKRGEIEAFLKSTRSEEKLRERFVKIIPELASAKDRQG